MSLTAPASGAPVSGTIPISAAASDNVGVAGLQFRLDGVDMGVELTAAPYSIQWNTTTAASGAHVLTAIARDQAGNTGTAAAVSVTVANTATVIVPGVIGQTRTVATSSIVAAGLTLGTVTTASSATVASGSVISQSPLGGTEVAANTGVALVVSSGPPQVTVPNVVGLTQAAALSAVTNTGLKAGAVSAVSSATVAAGLVISQVPAAGVTVASGTAVVLVVSAGPAKVAVPNVVGMTQAAAASAIANAGLVVGAVTKVSNAGVPAGSVISQDPAAGTGIPVTSPVDLVMSSGPGAIGINFVGSAIPMGAAEVAGVIPQANWNNAPGATGTALPLVDDSGASGTARLTWRASGVWRVSILDQPGNPRLMKGYLDNTNVSVTTVTVDGLSAGDYDVYVYCDGDNKAYNRTATYEISGPGITTIATVVNDAPNANFSGTFSEATGSTGNYVKFRITGSGFTVTATPGTSTNLNVRAPVDGIQIVPVVPAALPDFTINAVPPLRTVLPGTATSYTATITALNAFSGPVALSIAGAPSGTTATFTPSSVNGTGATLDITTSTSTPAGSWPLTVKGTSGQLSRTATVTLVVAQSRIGVKFLGMNPAPMAAADVAGVVPQAQWNNAAGAARSTPLSLVDESGTPSTATVTWSASNLWMVSIVDQAGNPRLMKGYLDNNNLSVTTVTVGGLAPGEYDVYVYCDGDNKAYNRTATYEISGPGIPPMAIDVNDAPGANFTGTFTQATNSAGNYVKFRITGSGFTITATPGTSTNVNVRAPVNGIQIVSTTPPPM